MQYETEKQDQQIAILKKDNLLQQEEFSRQKTVRNSFMGGLALVLMISGVAFNRYKTKQKINRQLAINLERLKHSQQQLIEQEKLASLGALTAGIAHEIKNPLNFINNFSEINIEITEDLPFAKNSEDRNKMLKDLKSNFEKITGHGIRADSIVKNMLAHSKNEVRPKELSDINEMCSEYLHISYKSVRVTYSVFRCELKSDLDPMIPHVKIIAQDFSRVLINIFTNAFHAVKEHKLINPGLSPEVSLTTRLENNLIAIYIKDNGIGMSNEVREKIFEPFYTTKPAGQGTGLGLSLSFDIIKSHNGDIAVASKPNEFTEFKITLPAT
jgi:signal transduction histidine kinase